MIEVSVIVPVYNTERYLRRCLESLVRQTLKELELILVDDGSTDGSGRILQEYEEKYGDRIRVFRKENGGQASARNLGIRKSRGSYIAFVDSDDCVAPEMFETMYQAAKEEQCDLVECQYRYLCEEGSRLKEYRTRGRIRQYKDQREMFIDTQSSPCNKLYRREVLLQEGVDFPEGFIYEDTAFYIKTIPFVHKERYLDQPFYHYFLRSSSTMNGNRSRRVGDIFPVLEDILTFYQRNAFFERFQKELEYFCVKILLCSSLSRIGRVRDKKLASSLYDRTFTYIREKFPDYKHNPYLRGKIGVYIRLVSRWNSPYIGRILGRLRKG